MEYLSAIKLPSLYDILVEPVSSKFDFDPRKFNFNQDGVPLNSNIPVMTTLAVYFAMVHLMPRFNFKLKLIFFLHNAILSLGSLILLALMLENLIPKISDNGLLWAVCHEDSYEKDSRLEFFFYINYLFKYYELLDTLFMILKGKKIEFLHWFHHSMTMLLCYTQLVGRTPTSWVPITLNLTVHVLMYYYYARTSISTKKVWWKKYLTTLQIIQFVIDLAVVNMGMYLGLVDRVGHQFTQKTGYHLERIPWGFFGQGRLNNIDYTKEAYCSGDLKAGFFGWALLSSYLLLFIEFFFKTYSKSVLVNARVAAPWRISYLRDGIY